MDELHFPAHPFTAAQAFERGIERSRLRAAVADGRLVKPMRGVYLRDDVEQTPSVRAQAARLVLSTSSVICDRSAAWMWGVDCHRHAELDGTPQLESCVLRGNQATEREEVDGLTRDLIPEDWVEVGGIRVTTPIRTAADLGCRLWAPIALGAMDALGRAHGFERRELQRLVRRFRGRRGVVQLRSLAALFDPRAESQPESWVRWFIVADGLACPDPQVWVHVEGAWYRLDLAYPRARVVVEFDGEEFHERTEEQRIRDRARRDALRRAGWVVIVVNRRGLTADGQRGWLEELRSVLREKGVRA